MTSIKAPGKPQTHDGSNLRIAIVHARWNTEIISALVSGCRKTLLASGVKEENIVVQDVPGSWELPVAVQRMHAASLTQASLAPSTTTTTSALTDLLTSPLPSLNPTNPPPSSSSSSSSSPTSPLLTPFNAIIAIGVLIKGETMHFEYIADAVSQGLMRAQLDTGTPVVFGVLTVLDEGQGMERAGLVGGKGHCHGEDWGRVAVEMGVKGKGWGEGGFL